MPELLHGGDETGEHVQAEGIDSCDHGEGGDNRESFQRVFLQMPIKDCDCHEEKENAFLEDYDREGQPGKQGDF